MFAVNGFYKDATAASKLVQVLAETFPPLSETSDHIPLDASLPCFAIAKELFSGPGFLSHCKRAPSCLYICHCQRW